MNASSPQPTGDRSRSRRRTVWICLVCALVLQALLFRQFCLREVVPLFPRGYDQTLFLGITYELYERIHEAGFRAGLAKLPEFHAPQGILLEAEAAFAQFVLGPGRLAALETNFAHLVLFEIALLAVASWLRRPWLGLALGGLLLSASSPYFDLGGWGDFRLDFAAFCLLGTLLCIAIRSAFFRYTSWTLLFGVTAGALILTRTIYALYLAPGLLALTVVLWAFRSVDPTSRRRVVNLVLAGLVLIVISVPSLLARWQAIQAYYLVGHRSEEAIRAREFGVFTSLDHLTYYARSAIVDHGGVRFLLLGACVVLALVLQRSRPPGSGEPEASGAVNPGFSGRDAWIGTAWLSVMTVTTYVVLTSDPSKSPVVGGVFLAVVIPAMLLLPSLLSGPRERSSQAIGEEARAAAAGDPGSHPIAQKARAGDPGWRMAVWLMVFLAGQGTFASHMVRRSTIAADGPDMREYGRLMDVVGRLCQHLGLVRPMVSFDAVTEFTYPLVVKIMAFERLRVLLGPAEGLGSIQIGLSAIGSSTADRLLERSDFALLGIDRDPNEPELYPVNLSLLKLEPHLYEKASREMVRVEEASFFGRHLTLFMRPVIRCSGESEGWITSAGLECHTAGAVLMERPTLHLRGTSNFSWLGGLPKATARIKQADEEVATVPCEVATGESSGALRPYTIACDVRGVHVAASAPATVAVSFDRHFVPKQIGVADDVRQLVLAWPNTIDAQR